MYYSQFNGPLSNDTITVGYDQVGRPINIQIGSAQASVQYDTLNRIVWSSNLLGVTSIEYTGATKRPAIISQPNGLTTTFEYSPVADGSRLQTMVTTNSSGQEISQFHYAYNINDLIIALTNISDGITTSWQYKYDLAKQLTEAHQWTNGILAHHYVYSYDKAGNRLSEQIDLAAATESPNELNQILDLSGGGQVKVAGFISETGSVSIAGSPAQMLNTTNFTGIITAQPGTKTFNVIATDPSGNTTTNWYNLTISANGLATAFSYDKAGNQLVKSNANQIFTFGWDGADRCTTITNGNFQTTLAYDGLSRWSRITEYSNSTLIADRRFIYIGTALAEERDATGTNIIKRFFANGFWQQGTNYYYNTDHLGSILEVTTQNGTIIAKFQYDPYGRRTQTFGTLWVDFGYAGLFELPNGLKLAVWRIYDPSTGRWINRDPIREQVGWNLYAYCQGNPVNWVDELGLYSPDDLQHVIDTIPDLKALVMKVQKAGFSIYIVSNLNDAYMKPVLGGVTYKDTCDIYISRTWGDTGADATVLQGKRRLVHELLHALRPESADKMNEEQEVWDATDNWIKQHESGLERLNRWARSLLSPANPGPTKSIKELYFYEETATPTLSNPNLEKSKTVIPGNDFLLPNL